MFGNCVSNPKAAAELKRKKKKNRKQEKGEKKNLKKNCSCTRAQTRILAEHTLFFLTMPVDDSNLCVCESVSYASFVRTIHTKVLPSFFCIRRRLVNAVSFILRKNE